MKEFLSKWKALKQHRKDERAKRGMTYIELLVALSLLCLIIVTFTPMMLFSYDNLYTAGEKTATLYNNKKYIETELSIREDDPFITGGLSVSFKEFTNNIVVKARQVAGSVPGLETLYGTGKAKVKVVSSGNIADNQSYYPVILRLVNMDATKAVAGSAHATGKTAIFVQSDIQKDKTISYTVTPSASVDDTFVKLEIKNVDISYAPFKIFIYYYDEYDKPKTTETYLYVSAADMIAVGKSTTNAQYISSAGVDASGNLLLAGRKMYDMEIPANTVINKVRWVSGAEGDASVNGGTYAMCGNDGFIRRLWNLNAASGASYTDVFDADKCTTINGITYFKSTWASDYTNSNQIGWRMDENWIGTDTIATLNKSERRYNNVQSGVYNSRFFAGTQYMIPISYVLNTMGQTEVAKLASSGYMFLNTSTDRKLFFSNGKGAGKDNAGNSIYLTPNWEVWDGDAGVKLNSDSSNDYIYNLNAYANCIYWSDSGLTNNASGSTYVPLIFFSYDNTASHVDRFYLAQDNNWGSAIGRLTFGTYYKPFLGSWTTGATGVDNSWVLFTTNGTQVTTGCPPRKKTDGKVYDYYSHYRDDATDSNGHATYNREGTGWCINYTDNWKTEKSHYCSLCDVAAKFTYSLPGYEFTPYANASSPTYAQVSANQKKVSDFIADYFASESAKQPLAASSAVFTGSSMSGSEKDEEAAFIRLKAYSNVYLRFDGMTSDLWKKVYSNLFDDDSDDLDLIDDDIDKTKSQVNLTDIAYVTSDSGSGCVYLGVSPAAAVVYSPSIDSAHASTTQSSAYRIFIIQSKGQNGYSVYESNDGVGHKEVVGKDVLPTYINTANTDYYTASFTLGYASNRSLFYTGLTAANMALQNTTSTDTSLNYPAEFFNITNYTNCDTVSFGVGYRVSGQAGVDVLSEADCTNAVHNTTASGTTVDGTVDLTNSAALFTDENFHRIYAANDTGDKAFRFSTYTNGPGTLVNVNITAQNQMTTVNGFFFEMHANKTYAYIGKRPTCAAAFTTFTDVGDATCNAVTNKGVIEYQNAGDASFTRISYIFGSGTAQPTNYKFTSVAAIKSKSSDNKIDLIIGASNGCFYRGSITYNQATGVVASTYITLQGANPDATKITNFRATLAAETSTTNYFFASGDQKTGNTVINYSLDGGSNWSTVTVYGTAYNIYDIQTDGDYLYAVGTDKASGSKGAVFYSKLSSCGSSNSWKVKTTYSTTFSSAIQGKDVAISGTDSTQLPPLYSLALKN